MWKNSPEEKVAQDNKKGKDISTKKRKSDLNEELRPSKRAKKASFEPNWKQVKSRSFVKGRFS